MRIFTLLITLGSAACSQAPDTLDPSRIDAGDMSLVAQGRALYAENCASCHGANLEGEANWRQRRENGRLPAPPHDETGHTWHHSDETLFNITKFGTAAFASEGYETDMAGFGDVMSDAEIIATLAFIKSQWPEEIREMQSGIE
ncbi:MULTISPECIES: c-type cytochrome [Hyphobacterium]|uniref:C-type cytochrome n=1 Tax=Hyphobacterium vulgare TaxID=1736751 RepID=A0ABV6ZW24_9PROT|nr:c-type cytochrome [Hyphobacterium sp. SN044]MBI1234362.1 c-type cytochrome [Alphaproteobacteria bacterium]MCF8881008.1 c-type cytochrome [Hyphobacterium sp. SN044]